MPVGCCGVSGREHCNNRMNRLSVVSASNFRLLDGGVMAQTRVDQIQTNRHMPVARMRDKLERYYVLSSLQEKKRYYSKPVENA